jgi:predicted Zn-dependent protease with MMP-like domain
VASPQPTLRRILWSALAALLAGVAISALIGGFSDTTALRLLQAIAVFGLGALIVGGAVVLALVRLAAWREPESEADFEALVERSERLAAGEEWDDDGLEEDLDALEDLYEPTEEDLFDPADEEDFRSIVRAAVDDLPLEFHRALEHVAIVVSDGGRGALPGRGRRRGAYGLYQGDTVARDHFHDRIVIFRDTLMRDFGHDPELLRAQVTRTLRHELAHHLGWDENGVHGLGL